MVDHRALYAELVYYWRDARVRTRLPPLRAWRLHTEPENYAEAVDPMRTQDGARVLVVSMDERYEPLIAADFRRITPLAAAPNAGGRTLSLATGEGFAPVARDAAFEARVDALTARPPANKRGDRAP
jgi:hypothetical protein